LPLVLLALAVPLTLGVLPFWVAGRRGGQFQGAGVFKADISVSKSSCHDQDKPARPGPSQPTGVVIAGLP
jgi:hypothetical protein